jgi:DNA-binding protein H-NS
MSDFKKAFLNQRSLRAIFRELTLEQIEEGMTKITAVADARREEEAQAASQNEERLRKIAEYKEMLRADGIDLSDLTPASSVSSIRAKREPRPAKYEYMDAEGNRQTWTGQGRQPVPIREAIEQSGKTLQDFLIAGAE